MTPSRRPRHRGPLHWIVALVCALVLAGCGRGGGTDTQPTAAASDGPTATASEDAGTEAATEAAGGGDREGRGNGRRYTVERGDTLSSIAERFDTTVRAIARANDIDDPNRIKVGQELRIPRR